MSDSLKCCPMCGSNSADYFYDEINDREVCSIVCKDCQFETKQFYKEDSAERMWNSIPRNLKWTKDKPVEDGYYWWRNEEGHILGIFCFNSNLNVMCINMEFSDINKVTGEFAGPINPPIN